MLRASLTALSSQVGGLAWPRSRLPTLVSLLPMALMVPLMPLLIIFLMLLPSVGCWRRQCGAILMVVLC